MIPSPFRRPLGMMHPRLQVVARSVRTAERLLQWALNDSRFASTTSTTSLDHRVKKHQSVLRRKLGATDMHLQEQKVQNLRCVIRALDGRLIRPGETLSFCRAVGPPLRIRGFVDGMQLSCGEAITGVGGGMCQASNLLYWLTLHSELTVKNDKGLEVELSIDEVTAKTKLPEHNGPDGKPQTVTFYQVEGEMDHVQLKTSSDAGEFDIPSDVSSFQTNDAQEKWLESTSKDAGNVTMDVEPRLHDLKDLENPAERNNESYKQFKGMLEPLMDYIFPGGTTDAIQKGAEAADQLGLFPKTDGDS